MDARRLVKVALPAKVVEAMDEAVDRHAGYDDRSQFIADAILSLVADLEVEGTGGPRAAPPALSSSKTLDPRRPQLPPEPTWRLSTQPMQFPDIGGPEQATLPLTATEPRDVAILAPAINLPVSADLPTPPAEPTWGMHNRDWPTLWAASELGRASVSGPVEFESWVTDLIGDAWSLVRHLRGAGWDVSGLPSNSGKPERSAGRFRSFFVGDKPGKGPIFSLGLAAPAQPGTVLLTRPGAELLRELSGLEPRRGVIRADWRAVFLSYLAAWVPQDFQLLQSVVRHISAGKDSRMELLESISHEYPEWNDKFVATNVAGFVARGREWNLIDQLQEKRRYSVVDDAIEALDEALANAEDVHSEYG